MPKKPEFPNDLERAIFNTLSEHKGKAKIIGARRGLMANELMSQPDVKVALKASKLQRALDASLARLKSRSAIVYVHKVGWETVDGSSL